MGDLHAFDPDRLAWTPLTPAADSAQPPSPRQVFTYLSRERAYALALALARARARARVRVIGFRV